MRNHNPFDDKSRLESPSNSANIHNYGDDHDIHFARHSLATSQATSEEAIAPTARANGRIKQQVATSNDGHENGEQPIRATTASFVSDEPVTIADIVGEYGPYQFSLTLLVFIRYVCVAMMTNTGPLIAPNVDFYCSQVPHSILASALNRTADQNDQQFLRGKCSFQYNNTSIKETSIYECSSWTFNTSQYGVTLTDSFDLVCGHNWLRSAFQSTVSFGVVIACVVWGSSSDRYGRYQTIRICFLVSLFSGIISYFATNFLLYTVSRAICSYGDLGLVVSLSTIMVETLGNKYRGAVCIIVYTGWAMGVMIMPWITDYFQNYRLLMLFTISCHLITLPWLLMVGESVRWSLVNGKIDQAREEVQRISWWNHANNTTASLKVAEEKFDQYKKKYVFLAEKRKLRKAIANNGAAHGPPMFGGMGKILQLFQTKELAITTITLVWTTFNSELLYMLFILINSDIGDDVKLNYAIGGIMEILASLISIVLISSLTRRFSLVSTLAIISSLCFVLAFTHNNPDISIWVTNSTKLAISTLSSIIYVATTEIFPTNVRQTGIGLSGTLGSCGAVVAPFIREELVNLIGMSSVMMIFVFLPLTAAILIPFFLKETKGIELSDDVEEISSIGVPEQILAEHPPPLPIAIIHGHEHAQQAKFNSPNDKWNSTANNDNLV